MFEGFLGNEALKRDVGGMLVSGSLPHALAICGRRGCGCGYFARLVAQEYLADGNGLVMRGEHPDFIELSGEGVSGSISVGSVRDDLYEMNMASVMADGRRVLFIRNARDLNDSSANALLKALEEPATGVLFLLTVRDPDDLMETIRSRVSFCYALPLDEDVCAAEAVRRVPSCTQKDAEKLSGVFSGRLGLVLDVLTDQQTSDSYRAAAGFCEAALAGKRYDAMMWSASRIESREDYRNFLEMCSLYCGWLLREAPEKSGRISVISEALNEAYRTANSVNLKLSSARLAEASLKH